MVDGMQEIEKGRESIGTTKKGIGPTYSTKVIFTFENKVSLDIHYNFFVSKNKGKSYWYQIG